jgi:hypothetical protein
MTSQAISLFLKVNISKTLNQLGDGFHRPPFADWVIAGVIKLIILQHWSSRTHPLLRH